MPGAVSGAEHARYVASQLPSLRQKAPELTRQPSFGSPEQVERRLLAVAKGCFTRAKTGRRPE